MADEETVDTEGTIPLIFKSVANGSDFVCDIEELTRFEKLRGRPDVLNAQEVLSQLTAGTVATGCLYKIFNKVGAYNSI